jgi:hypothetical protein
MSQDLDRRTIRPPANCGTAPASALSGMWYVLVFPDGRTAAVTTNARVPSGRGSSHIQGDPRFFTKYHIGAPRHESKRPQP